MVANDSMQWNDYQDIDLKGKWVLMLRGYPESNPAASAYSPFSSDRMKVLTARENGAAGVLLVSGEAWDPADNLDKPSRGESSAGIPVLQIKRSCRRLHPEAIRKNCLKELEERLLHKTSDLRASLLPQRLTERLK